MTCRHGNGWVPVERVPANTWVEVIGCFVYRLDERTLRGFGLGVLVGTVVVSAWIYLSSKTEKAQV
jgi:hypothetical protein